MIFGQNALCLLTIFFPRLACNTIIQGVIYGIYTLRNYGRRINCTMSILFSASFRILSMNVGQSYRRLDSMIHSPKNYVAETGVIKKVSVTLLFFLLKN